MTREEVENCAGVSEGTDNYTGASGEPAGKCAGAGGEVRDGEMLSNWA